VASTGELRAGPRADAGGVRLTARDISALVWCGEMYGVRADLLASLLGVSADVVRQSPRSSAAISRWKKPATCAHSNARQRPCASNGYSLACASAGEAGAARVHHA
jgi:hypothetical protein